MMSFYGVEVVKIRDDRDIPRLATFVRNVVFPRPKLRPKNCRVPKNLWNRDTKTNQSRAREWPTNSPHIEVG